MQNSMVMFTFYVFGWKYFFGQFWSKKSKLSVLGETRYLYQLEYAEFNDDVHFFRFRPEILFLGKFVQKNQNSKYKVKLDTLSNSNMRDSMMLFTFFAFDRKYSFCANLVQKVKIVRLRWNLILTLIRICRIQWWCSLFTFLARNIFFGQIWSKESKLSV